MLYVLERVGNGYRVLDMKLFDINESKPMITRDSEGLAAIDFDGVFKTVKELGLLDKPLLEPEELLCIQSLYRRNHVRISNAPRDEWRTLEWFKARNMRR